MRPNSPEMPAKLAQSAFELFSQKGIHNVNLDSIAAHAKVTKGSIYWHFKSKHEVILAACSHYYRSWQQQIQRELAAIQEPGARLRKVIQFSVRSCLLDEKNRVFTIEIFSLSLYHEDIRRSWLQFYESVREVYIGLVLAAQAAGKLDVPDPRLGVDFMLEAMEGIKLRAMYEPHICSKANEVILADGLVSIISHLGALPVPRSLKAKEKSAAPAF
jgi:AcrR family transcriptional regulator